MFGFAGYRFAVSQTPCYHDRIYCSITLMPEGPEIRIAADKVEKALSGRKTTNVFFAFDALKSFQRQLTGLRVLAVETRGKAMLTRFENDWVIYSHNQLYGRWVICRDGVLPDTRRQLRVAIHNKEQSALLYSASDIEVLPADELSRHPFLSKLGPDCLSKDITPKAIVDRLRSTDFSNRQLAGLLLDQCFIAGLGNYLRAEILYFAAIHPKIKPANCSPGQLDCLARQIIKLTRRSYTTGGIVNPPALVKALKLRGMRRKSQYRFSVYKRDGKACYRCGQAIESNVIGGRNIYFCPNCQSPD